LTRSGQQPCRLEGYAPLRPTPTISVVDKSWILIDENTGLHVGWYFWLRVLDEVNRSARYGAPFSLLLLEIEASPASAARAIDEAVSRVPDSIRSTDLGGVVGAGRVGVLLPHQDVDAAGLARERVLERLKSASPRGVRWESRLLHYPGDGAEISNLLTCDCRERRPADEALGVERLA
jgi:GGDEF domain-containing protein